MLPVALQVLETAAEAGWAGSMSNANETPSSTAPRFKFACPILTMEQASNNWLPRWR
jgi:hypothetical protein